MVNEVAEDIAAGHRLDYEEIARAYNVDIANAVCLLRDGVKKAGTTNPRMSGNYRMSDYTFGGNRGG